MSNLTILPADAGVESQYLPVIRLWMLRVLVRRADRSHPLLQANDRAKEIRSFLGLGRSAANAVEPQEAEDVLRAQLAAAERRPCTLPENTRLACDVRKIACDLGLSDVERDILHFACLVKKYEPLALSIDGLGGLSLGRLFQIFGICLGYPMQRVRAAMERRKVLALLAPSQRFLSDGSSFVGIWGNRVRISHIYG